MLSVICPVYNEALYIHRVLEFFLGVNPREKELIIIDGGSTDGTVEIIQEYASIHRNITFLHNPKKYVPFALNAGIAHSSGEIIVRLDAHTEYAEDYFEQILNTFEQVPADIVGGPMRAIGKTNFQKAIALATSTPMGVGNSLFHFENYSGYTESVYLGAWRKTIFHSTGLFDEQMKRNQDDEFHYRAKSLGHKIYQNSAIRSYYFPRSSPWKLCKQYFEYGLYKPLVLIKIRSGIRLRHLIPTGFVLYLLSLTAFHPAYWFLPLSIYVLGAVFFSIRSKESVLICFYMFISFFLIHLSYGSGFIIGIKKIFQRRANIRPSQFTEIAQPASTSALYQS